MRERSGARQYGRVRELAFSGDWNRRPLGCATFEFASSDQIKLSWRSVRSDQHLGNVANGNDVSAAHQHSGKQRCSVREALQLVRTRELGDRARRKSEALLPYRKQDEGVFADAERSHGGCAHADTARFAGCALLAKAACTSFKSPG